MKIRKRIRKSEPVFVNGRTVYQEPTIDQKIVNSLCALYPNLSLSFIRKTYEKQGFNLDNTKMILALCSA